MIQAPQTGYVTRMYIDNPITQLLLLIKYSLPV